MQQVWWMSVHIKWFLVGERETWVVRANLMTHFTRVSTAGLTLATFSPEFLVAVVSRLSVRQEAAEGRVESIIFRYCCLARHRMAFKSLSGIEVEFDVSSFCPGQTQTGNGLHFGSLSDFRFWLVKLGNLMSGLLILLQNGRVLIYLVLFQSSSG